MSTDCEQTHVCDVYNLIADEFSDSRNCMWKGTKVFLDAIPSHSIVLDAGCGNGKNMMYRSDLVMKGIDFCPKFVNICEGRGLDVTQANILTIPYADDTFDYVISTAVIHHLDSASRRMNAINECIRVCKPNGKVYITLWAFEQDPTSKHTFVQGVNYVPWKGRKHLSDPKSRYYYLYDRKEIHQIKDQLEADEHDVVIEYERSNHVLIVTKSHQ
jgi:tRNA (uracil-5-)-methyltransferase TRM9